MSSGAGGAKRRASGTPAGPSGSGQPVSKRPAFPAAASKTININKPPSIAQPPKLVAKPVPEAEEESLGEGAVVVAESSGASGNESDDSHSSTSTVGYGSCFNLTQEELNARDAILAQDGRTGIEGRVFINPCVGECVPHQVSASQALFLLMTGGFEALPSDYYNCISFGVWALNLGGRPTLAMYHELLKLRYPSKSKLFRFGRKL